MKKILVVDDSQSVRETLVLVLRHAGFEAAGAAAPAAALEAARVQCPDILLCDVQLEGSNGVELSQQIAKSHPNCRIILISGDTSSTAILADARERGYTFEVLAKPTLPRELLEALNAA